MGLGSVLHCEREQQPAGGAGMAPSAPCPQACGIIPPVQDRAENLGAGGDENPNVPLPWAVEG